MPDILFDHIAIAMECMAAAPAVLVGELGGVPDSDGSSADFNWRSWRFSGGGCIEVIEPRGAAGFLHRFLAQRGPGIHHVTFRVPSLREACDRAEQHAYQVLGYDDSNPQWATAVLHPKQALGIVVQFAQSSVGAAPPWQAPPGPANLPPAVAILGLRMRARSRDRARIQWERVLGGAASEGAAGELVYRWPGSPMQLTVEINPSREEGPLCVEVTSARAISLPDGPYPKLGTIFVRRG